VAYIEGITLPRLQPLAESQPKQVDPNTAQGAGFLQKLERRIQQNELSGRASIGRGEAPVAGSRDGPIDGRTDNVMIDGQAGNWQYIFGSGYEFMPYAAIDRVQEWIGQSASWAATGSLDRVAESGNPIAANAAPPSFGDMSLPSISANEVRNADGETGKAFTGFRYLGLDALRLWRG
jgi:hypothetical protein